MRIIEHLFCKECAREVKPSDLIDSRRFGDNLYEFLTSRLCPECWNKQQVDEAVDEARG
jgi:hypothetical protein